MFLSRISSPVPLLVSALFAGYPQLASSVEVVEFCNMKHIISKLEPSPKRQNLLISSHLKDKAVVYIGGFFNCSSDDFKDNESLIEQINADVPIYRICPDSKLAIQENADKILARLAYYSDRHPQRKYLIFGQSKGGAETLQLSATHPSIFTIAGKLDHGFVVHRAIAVNSAIGGTTLADLALNRDPILLERWSEFKDRLGLTNNFFGKVLKWLLLDDLSAGFKSLTTSEAAVRNQQLKLQLSFDSKSLLQRKLLYVTSERSMQDDAEGSKDLPFYLKNLAKFMFEHGHQNDGLVFESNQRLEGIGTHYLSVKNAGHFSLAGSYDKPSCRKDFMRYLLLKLAMDADH